MFPDHGMHFLSLLCRRGLSRSDGPNRFVGDYYFLKGIRTKMKQRFLDLLLNQFFMRAGFADFQRLPTTENRSELPRQCAVNFLGQEFSIFSKILPALTMTQN